MIQAYYKEDIINRLAVLITYGLNNKYTFTSIEEYILSSKIINDLENNQYDEFSSNEKVVESTFNIKLKDSADISFRGLFIAETYIKLFFDFNKSFEYLFLYWPLSLMVEKYNIYHEMDYSNLRNDFIEESKRQTLIKKICLKKDIKYTDISKLTGININTIIKFSRDNKYLYLTSHEIVYKLSRLLNVKENLFVNKLDVYLDPSIYLVDNHYKNYLNYLGLYFASYFNNEINNIDFVYKKEKDYYISTDGRTKLLVANIDKIDISKEYINSLTDENTYIVIFSNNFNENNLNNYSNLKICHAKEIIIISHENVFTVKKRTTKEITDTINKSLIIRAKESTQNA